MCISANAEREHLEMRPFSGVLIRPLRRAVVLTCQVNGAVINANYNIKWIGPDGREIVNESGR